MTRAQIQFTDAQIQELRDLSAKTGRSIADLTRDAITMYLGRQGKPTPKILRERAREIAGQFSSGHSNVSAEHDRYIGEAFSE